MLFMPREEGQGLAEYGLILVLIAVIVVVVLALLGSQISALFAEVQAAIPAP